MSVRPAANTSVTASGTSDKPLRVLWLHTQPEHYFNLMIDDLNRSDPEVEYIAAFCYKGTGTYQELPLPKVGRSLVLQPRPGLGDEAPRPWDHYHNDWRAEIEPLDAHAVVVSGYAGTTQRELLGWCHEHGIPCAMWSDSNLRSQRGDSIRKRLFRQVKRQFLRPLIDSVDYLLTANRLGMAYWRYYGAPGVKILRCPCYADYARIERAAEITRVQAFAAVGLDPAAKLILSGARLVPAKALDLGIKAFLESGLAAKGYIYAIAGNGPLEAELKTLAGDALGRSIQFLGFRQPADLLPLMRHADLFLLPSLYEPHGIVIQEALAAGTPVLASDVCGAAYDLLETDYNGWLFRAGRQEELTDRLRRFAASAERSDALRRNARASFDAYLAIANPVNVVRTLAHQLLMRAGQLDPTTGHPRADMMPGSLARPLRIAICQPLIPRYRVPVFDLLGRQPGVRLVVLGGHSQGSLEAIHGGRYFRADLAPVDPLPLLLRNLVTQAAQLEVLDHNRFDLVILPWDIHYISMFRALRRARRIGLPVVLWGHGYSKKRLHRIFDPVRNWVGRRASGLLLYTRTVADQLVGHHGFDPQRVFVAQNALDQEPIQNARAHWLARPDELAAFQRQHGITPDNTLIFVSRLERSNRVDLLLDAAQILGSQGRPVKLVLVGTGADEPRLRTLARQKQLTDRVVFTGAIYDDMRLAPWMLSAGVFAYPTEIGLSILHAFGYGLPVVTSDNLSGQNPEIEALQVPGNGLLYHHGDAADLARCCGEILADPERRRTMGAAALQQVLERYTLAHMVQGFLDATRMVDGQQRHVQAAFSH